MATHTPDIHIWKPVFVEGELVCFVAGHIHNTDMGGAVPATLSRTLTEIEQEGLRIPPVKILQGGVFDQKLLSVMERNVRVPKQNWGDLNAQVASVAIGERKLKEIVARFGLPAFKQGMIDLMDYAEAQARAIIRTIPNGDYFHAEFADEGFGRWGIRCRIALTLRVRDDDLDLDYTGSDPQLKPLSTCRQAGAPGTCWPWLGWAMSSIRSDNNLL